jgi:predicted Zn-dependent protease
MSRRDKIEALLKDDPNDAFLLYALALEDRGAGDFASAISRLKSLRDSQPGYVPTYLALGQLLAQEAAIDEARTVLRDGIAAASSAGDDHAAGEMRSLLQEIGG